tara:strand:- start:635 stop:913 length:279 start_codon:yes stop_codon:yes gene_type:complete
VDPVQFLEQFGLPVTGLAFFGYFIWKQQHWIQKDLVKDMDEKFKRLEGIIITLISQIKKAQLDIKELKGFVNGIEDILTKLTGNGLKDKDKK